MYVRIHVKCPLFVSQFNEGCIFSTDFLKILENQFFLIFYYEHAKTVKCTLVQALRVCTGCTAHRGIRGIALLFLDQGTRRGEVSASRPGRSLTPGETRYPLYRGLGGPQGRSGEVRKISPPPGFDRRKSSVAKPTELPGLHDHSTCIEIKYLNKK